MISNCDCYRNRDGYGCSTTLQGVVRALTAAVRKQGHSDIPTTTLPSLLLLIYFIV